MFFALSSNEKSLDTNSANEWNQEQNLHVAKPPAP